jgi:hypothetical protein
MNGLDSSLAGLGAARGWRRSCRFIASACAPMLIVAAGSRFPEANPPDGNSYPPDAIAIGYGCRCGGRVGQSRRHEHDQEGGVSIVGEAGPRRGRQDPSHQDCCSRSATRRAPAYGHTRRSVVCTPLCPAKRLAHSPRNRQNEWRARQSERRSEVRGVGPVPPDRHARSHMQHRLLHLRVRRARGQRKDHQVLG